MFCRAASLPPPLPPHRISPTGQDASTAAPPAPQRLQQLPQLPSVVARRHLTSPHITSPHLEIISRIYKGSGWGAAPGTRRFVRHRDRPGATHTAFPPAHKYTRPHSPRQQPRQPR
ncbi:hypothetical protein PLESTF_000346800 [Pleodorina starrii]|nr:hypothetical protein PLESTF_000346800 [Pleodorina starrii]